MHTFLLMMLAVALPGGISPDDTLQMEHGVEYMGAEMPSEVNSGGTARIELYFRLDGKLPDTVKNFLHVEASGGDCRAVGDRRPTNYQTADGQTVLVHEVSVRIPAAAECTPSELDVYTGFWEVDSGARYEVTGMSTPDNRIPVGSMAVVADGRTGDATQVATPSQIQRQQVLKLLRPWWGWLGGLALAIVLVFLLRWLVRRRGEGGESDEQADPVAPGLGDTVSLKNWWVIGGIVLLAVPALMSILAALDFVKDDAYISFRYAQNLVVGEGLVFNPGEYVEGFTNFLWTLVIAPFEAMGLDLFQVTEIIGTALVLGLLVQLTWLSFHLMGGPDSRPRRDLSHLWAGLWLASSSSLGLWSTSGMEQPLAMFLPLAGAYLLWTSWDDDTTRAARRAGASGVLIGLGCMTRPEIHLIGILLGLPLVWRTIRDRRLDTVTKYWFAGLLGITVPFHAFRLWYFGGLLPNTYYVKTGGGDLVMNRGLQKLHDLFWFNGTGFLALLVPFAFLRKKHMRQKLIMLGVSAGFMAYVVKVGVDEMKWHRLYLPALPFLVMLAALGLRNLCSTVAGLLRLEGWKRLVVYGVGGALVVAGAAVNLGYTINAKDGFNGRGPLSGNYHPDIGKYLTRHARPGALVAFQDMGSTPYHAPDLKFLDFIGLVDHTVARARHSYGLHAFIPTGDQETKNEYDAEMREYFYERAPEWVILTSYIPSSRVGHVSREFGKNPGPEALEPYIGSNTYQFQIYNEKFKRRYTHVRTWPRSATYYLSVFRRTDLYDKTPGEVVIGSDGNTEAGPALDDNSEPGGEMGGVEATFAGGLKLLGSKLEQQAIEKQEFFVTTWWQLPGSMSEDIFFFLHAERADYRHPYDHIPGDWLYPADRWQTGQILEDRTLFQIPQSMAPGAYDIYMGAYHKRTGQRLKLVDGPGDGQNRLKLGTVKVRSFRPYLDHIIQPTRLDVQRKYPTRIPDHKSTTPPWKTR